MVLELNLHAPSGINFEPMQYSCMQENLPREIKNSAINLGYMYLYVARKRKDYAANAVALCVGGQVCETLAPCAYVRVKSLMSAELAIGR